MAENRDDQLGDARSGVIQMLMRKIEEDAYPSTTMMDMLEGLLEPEDLPDYVDVLRSKIEDETYPSVPMMQRLLTLTAP